MKRYHSQAELYKMAARLQADPKPMMSISMFAELAGISRNMFYEVFINKSYPMTEMMQIRVSRAFDRLEGGEVIVMRNHDNSRVIKFEQNPRPRMKRSMGLTVVDGEIKIKTGLRNRGDYTEPTFKELVDGE